MIKLGRLLLLAVLLVRPAFAGVWAMPGDSTLRADLALLTDRGRIDLPLSTWPIARGDIARVLSVTQVGPDWSPAESVALTRVQSWLGAQRHAEAIVTSQVAAALRPFEFRTFDSTPREQGEIGIAIDWQGEHLFANLQATGVSSPDDG